MTIDHEFKSHPDVFWPAARGEKTFEYRRDDRGGYEVGQTVRLRCYDPDHGYHGNPPLDRRITNILRGGEFELPMGYCILSLAPLASPRADSDERTAGGWRKVMRDLIAEHDKHACLHEETHRGGAIWTICDHCGRKWADDEGGFQPYEEPAAVTAAWALLKCEDATPAQPAGAVPDGLRALSEAASKGRFKVVRGLHDYAVVPEAREQKGPLNSADADFAAASANHIRDILASHPAGQSAGSGAETDALVDRFSAALKVKLRAAEAKYGWKNGWLKSNWQVECQNGLLRHVGKGDPLDVAAYAAFCWHHGWPSASRRSTDFVTGAVIPTAGAIAAYETRYPEGSLSETSDNAIEAWNRVAAAVCLAEKPAPDSTRTDQVGVAVEQAVAKAAERAVEQLENAASGGLFHCEADREEAVEIVTEAIWTSPLAARPAAPEAQGADDLAERLRREIGEIRTMAADPENKAAFCELTVVADNLEALLPAPPSSGQGGR
ncbi:ribosomal protein L37AE/L43A [Methylorubrum rhodesianum]|uniref:DUF3850 domain-containing protein n=1 Tax=Methylorubrum rhodesianum TaxID=29427 RepID=UPI0016110430|nr:DUF3850 domain-containing protein [Methylorubrum rhodesianum]MBB5762104.1 ribosomal protein L37AE/L43A [Methylorubrum rhodesianum]